MIWEFWDFVESGEVCIWLARSPDPAASFMGPRLGAIPPREFQVRNSARATIADNRVLNYQEKNILRGRAWMLGVNLHTEGKSRLQSCISSSLIGTLNHGTHSGSRILHRARVPFRSEHPDRELRDP